MNRFVKRLVRQFFQVLGISIARGSRSSEEVDLLEAVLATVLSTQSKLNVVQVGANDGCHGDPIYAFLTANADHTSALLIEPQPELIPLLEANYATHPRIKIFNGAVGQRDELTLYRIKPSLWESFDAAYLRDAPAYRAPSGVTSSNMEHVLTAAKKNLRSYTKPEEAIERIEVPCKLLVDVLSSTGFPRHIDLLQIDAEGSDDQVIYACSISELRPALIHFETKHLPKSRMLQLESYLMENNYQIYHYSLSDTLAISRPREPHKI